MSVKLYKHNESGEVVRAIVSSRKGEYVAYAVLKKNRTNVFIPTEIFKRTYSPLPETPEEHSTPWAILMLENGCNVRQKSWKNKEFYIFKEGNRIIGKNGDLHGIDELANDWELYEEPKRIVECLPHELPQDVLCRNSKKDVWQRADIFKTKNFIVRDNHTTRHFVQDAQGLNFAVVYCLPYIGNKHLEGTVTEGEHGAVPKGYVPPHTPKFGDENYWQVEDKVVNLCTTIKYCIKEIHNDTLLCIADGRYHYYPKHQKNLRNLYHRGSYVREDGTVCEHVPTRPYRIEKE